MTIKWRLICYNMELFASRIGPSYFFYRPIRNNNTSNNNDSVYG